MERVNFRLGICKRMPVRCPVSCLSFRIKILLANLKLTFFLSQKFSIQYYLLCQTTCTRVVRDGSVCNYDYRKMY